MPMPGEQGRQGKDLSCEIPPEIVGPVMQPVEVTLPGGHVETVLVHAHDGPTGSTTDGHTTILNVNFSFETTMPHRYNTGKPVNPKKWWQMSPSEKEVILQMAAKKLKSQRDLASLVPKKGRGREFDLSRALDLLSLPASTKALLQVSPVRDRSPSPVKQTSPSFVSDENPLLVCWYSGGFSREEGEKLLEPFLEAARSRGITDIIVLHHSNEYGLTGEGYWQWPFYVTKLVEEINNVSATRPLILMGHSKGVCPALSVATRCGSRVLKVYLVACGAWGIRQETPWETLARAFKEQKEGDRALLLWFSSLNPYDIFLATTAMLPADELQEAIEGSAFLRSKLHIMRTQYRNAMYPDMSSGEVIDTFSADIGAVALAWDFEASYDQVKKFEAYTNGNFNIFDIAAGHMDCVSNPQLHTALIDDMLRFFH